MFKLLLKAFILVLFTNFSVNSQKLVHSTEINHEKTISSTNHKALYYDFEKVRSKILNPKLDFDMLRAEKLFRKSGITLVPDLKSFFKLTPNRFLSLSDQSDEIKLLLKTLNKEYIIQKNKFLEKKNSSQAKNDDRIKYLLQESRNAMDKMKLYHINGKKLESFIKQADLNYFSNSKEFFTLTKNNVKDSDLLVLTSEIKLIVKQIDKLHLQKYLKLKTDTKLVSLFERYTKVKHSASKANFNYRQLDHYLNQNNRKFLNGESTFLSLAQKDFFILSNLHYKDCLSAIEYIESCLLIDSSKPKL
tara:strand:+ start:512 stop:1423 length:912 start_codon:yes stop_codon:yes gene_type:complete